MKMYNKNRNVLKMKRVGSLKAFMYVCCTQQIPLLSQN